MRSTRMSSALLGLIATLGLAQHLGAQRREPDAALGAGRLHRAQVAAGIVHVMLGAGAVVVVGVFGHGSRVGLGRVEINSARFSARPRFSR